jgi:hypothetical protein
MSFMSINTSLQGTHENPGMACGNMQVGKEAEVDGKLLPEIVSRIDGWRMVTRGK